MNIIIAKLVEEAEFLTAQGRLTLAKQSYEDARLIPNIPEQRAWISYNLGVLNWIHFGNGVNARREFLLAINDIENYGYGKTPALKIMHANAVENAMLCALSYNEFEELAKKLRILAPNEPILSGLLPKVRKLRESGNSWAEFSLMNATGYYDRGDPKLDAGRYGEAMSVYHLLLANRQKLRLKREDWRIALVEYCALAHRLSSNCQFTRGGEDDFNSPEEFLPILTETLPFIDEYLASNPGDKIIKEQKDSVNQIISLMRQRWAEIPSANSGILSRWNRIHRPSKQPLRKQASYDISESSSMFREGKKGVVSLIFPIICTVTGIWLGGLLGGIIGMFIGLTLLLASNFATKYVRNFRCDFCGRLFEKVKNSNEFVEGMSVMIRTDQLMSGKEGVGYECVECQRTICSDCEVFCSDNELSTKKCRCGSVKFRSVHLVYR